MTPGDEPGNEQQMVGMGVPRDVQGEQGNGLLLDMYVHAMYRDRRAVKVPHRETDQANARGLHVSSSSRSDKIEDLAT